MSGSPFKTDRELDYSMNEDFNDILDEYRKRSRFLSNRIILLEFEREVMTNFILACGLEEEMERFKEGYLVGLKTYSH